MSALIVIVADDITGAADCGAACSAAGLSTVVAMNDAVWAKDLDGRMFIQGVALEETEIWQNEKIGGVANIRSLLEKAGMRAASIGLKNHSLRCRSHRHCFSKVFHQKSGGCGVRR